MTEGEGKLRIAHLHAPRRTAFDLHRTGGQALQPGLQFQIQNVQTFLQPLHQKFPLPGLPGLEPVHIIRRARFPIRPRRADRNHVPDLRRCAHPGKSHRVISGGHKGARHPVRSHRQDQFRGHPRHTEPASRR